VPISQHAPALCVSLALVLASLLVLSMLAEADPNHLPPGTGAALGASGTFGTQPGRQ